VATARGTIIVMNRVRAPRASIVWASDRTTGAARHISEAHRGLACDCTCVGCGSVLEAVNSENPNPKRRMHFRHPDRDETDACVTGAVLAGARAQLRPGESLMLPAYTVTGSARAADGREFHALEQSPQRRVGIEQLQWIDETDAVLTLADGRQLRIRLVAVSGALSAERTGSEEQLAEILIDVSDPALRDADPEALRAHITLDTAAKRWCQHWQASELVAEATRVAQGKADQYWQDKQAAAAARVPAVPPAPPVSRILSESDATTLGPTVTPGLPSRGWLSGSRPRAEPMWAASRQVTPEDRKKALGIAQAVYYNGDRGAAPRIDYPALIEEAIAARAIQQPLRDKLAEWQSRYRMVELKPILDVLRAAQIVR